MCEYIQYKQKVATNTFSEFAVCRTSFWERLLLSNLCGEMYIATS